MRATSGPVSAPPLAAEATPLPLQATFEEAPKQSLAAFVSLGRQGIDRSEQLSIDFHEDAEVAG